MRLRRLDLVRYGKFTDASIDFGQAPAGRADLHIVYGPNEAGKSTAFSAFLDLLFGIDETKKPGYGFLHRPASLRIGAALETAGGLHEVVRLLKQPLLDRHERPLTDRAILDELSGLTRETYRTMFSLDDDTLEAGGKSIIASDGELGQLLFSASAGLSGFSRNLATLRVEAEAFFKPAAHARQLNEFRKRLKDLKQRKDDVDTLASVYGQLATRRERTRAAYEEALKQRGATRTGIDALTRRLAALPKLVEFAAKREMIGSLPEGLPIPAGWDVILPGLQMADVELQTRLEGIEGELRRLAGDLDAIQEDDGSLAVATAMEGLAQARVRHAGAESDLPDRRMRLRDAEVDLERLRGLIDAPAGLTPSELPLPARVVGRLRELIESRSGIDVALATARSEEAKAAHRIDELAAPAMTNAGPATDRKRRVGVLTAAIAVAEGGDQRQRARLAERSRTTHAAMLASRLLELGPWTGDADALAVMALPTGSDVEDFKESITHAEKEGMRLREERARLAKELVHVDAEAGAIARVGGPPDDGAADAARRARDEAWTAHLTDLQSATAVAFEHAMRADDNVGARRLAGFADVVRLRETERISLLRHAEIATLDEELASADARIATLREEWTALVRSASSQLASLSPSQVEAWRPRRDRALETAAALRVAEDDLAGAAADDSDAREALGAALHATTSRDVASGDLAGLVLEAREELRALEASLARDVVLAEALSVHGIRRAALLDASEAAARWERDWNDAKTRTWLSDCDPAADVPTAREILALLEQLGPALDRREGFADRISKMEKDQSAFAAAIGAIGGELGIPTASRDALGIADEIDARVMASRAAAAARVSKAKDVAEAERRRVETCEALAAHQRRRTEMTGYFGVGTLTEVAAAIAVGKRRDALESRCVELEDGIVEDLRATSFVEASAMLSSCDRASLEHSLSELEPRYEDQDLTVREAFAAMRTASDALDAVGGDDAPARLEEEKRTVLLEIEDGAMRYLSLRAGILATEAALQRYRERHRSSMMERASAAFETISGGAYTGLAAQMTKDSETLVGKVAGGGSKLSTEMSKGTRFQLYLALRVSGYQEFVRGRPAVPFIADDIMETFDDARAEQAFRLFSKMAEAGQVIYLTHHPHLCEIARKTCPSVTIHRLEDVDKRMQNGEIRLLSA